MLKGRWPSEGGGIHDVDDIVQGGVTSIGAVLPPATGVKKFDRGFFTLTLDFARKKKVDR